MRAFLTRGSVMLAVLVALAATGAFAAAAAIICHPDPAGTKTAKVKGPVAHYRMHGLGVNIVYRGQHGCRRAHWTIGRQLSRGQPAPDTACADRGAAGTTPAGGTGRVSLVHGSADLPDRVRVVSAGGTSRSWPLPEPVERLDAFGSTAVFAASEREVYAVDLRNGRVALVGLDRHGDVPQIDRPGVVFQDNLYKENEYSGQTLMKFIPSAAVDRSLSRSGTPVDLPGRVEAIGMDGYRVALAVHEPGECAQIMYWNIAWNYVSKITDEDERTCQLTENGGEIRSVAVAGIRSAWVIRSRNAERLLTSNSTACFDRIVATVPRENGRLASPSGDGPALGFAMTNASPEANVLGTVGEREVQPLVRGEGAPIAISVDAGRFAVLNRDGTIDLRSAAGQITGTIRTTGAAAIALRANHLIVLTRSGRLQVFGTETQAKLRDWAAPARSATVDVQYGVAVLTAGGNVHAVSLATGRRSLVASVPGKVIAQVEPSGVAYAYNTGTHGHLRFVRFARLESAMRRARDYHGGTAGVAQG
jgi:hypothetical protein